MKSLMDMTDGELRDGYRKATANTQFFVADYEREFDRRALERNSTRMLHLTWAIAALTGISAIATIMGVAKGKTAASLAIPSPASAPGTSSKIFVVFSDHAIIIAFQALLFCTVLFAWCRDHGIFMRKSPFEGSSTVRGEETWRMLELAFGIAAISTLQILGSSGALEGHKVVLGFFDLGCFVYLFFRNGWFRNKTITFVTKSKGMEEPVR